MIFNIIKVLITAFVIVIAAEVAKRSSLLGGLIVSMPLITVLTLIWLYWDTKDVEQVSNLTSNTLLMIIPSLTFFLFFPILLKINLSFSLSMLLSILSTGACYWIYTIFLNYQYFKQFNLSLF